MTDRDPASDPEPFVDDASVVDEAAGGDGPLDPDVSDPTSAERGERRERLVAAAYHAEYTTGRRERTERQAKRNIIVRLVLITVGGVVFLAGLSMLLLPGPGILVTLVGLGILSREFAWADRLLKIFREKSHVDDVGKLPIWAQVALGVVSLAAVIAGIVWVLIVL